MKRLSVLVACEYSGAVRDAMLRNGHDAWSCDLLPSDAPGPHIQGDALEAIASRHWDLMIAHPPCTYLCVSGMHWTTRGKRPRKLTDDALDFVRSLMAAPIDRIAIENPVSVISTEIRRPDQYIQPWQFGHGETKKTGLWLKGLPPLRPTNIVNERADRIHKMPPGPDRWKQRSATYTGIAQAMADQWAGQHFSPAPTVE